MLVKLQAHGLVNYSLRVMGAVAVPFKSFRFKALSGTVIVMDTYYSSHHLNIIKKSCKANAKYPPTKKLCFSEKSSQSTNLISQFVEGINYEPSSRYSSPRSSPVFPSGVHDPCLAILHAGAYFTGLFFNMNESFSASYQN